MHVIELNKSDKLKAKDVKVYFWQCFIYGGFQRTVVGSVDMCDTQIQLDRTKDLSNLAGQKP